MNASPTPTADRSVPQGCPKEWSDLVSEAEHRGYLSFLGERVRYHCAKPTDQAFADPEEKVRAAVYSWLIIEKEYPPEAIGVEVRVPRRTPSDYADLVVYSDSSCRTPYLVVETKAPRRSVAAFRQAVEQVFGNANSLRDTMIALVDSGDRSALYQVAGHPHDEREANRLGSRRAVPVSYGSISRFGRIAGDPDDDIAPCGTARIEHLVRRVHGFIWSGGRRDPFSAFDEWCKIFFAKIYDEQHTPTGSPRRFQIGRREPDVSVANRIRSLYADACLRDASVFRSDLQLPDNKIVQVVRAMEDIAFTQTDMDSLGAAFERFFGSAFRGEFGQYFTRREICRFVCAFLEPTERDRILDPTCGSGGFLLEALIQVWRYIDEAFVGQPQGQRRKRDFTWQNLFGIEIHASLGRICQTNLMLHRDGHTNIEVGKSCLDTEFDNPHLDPRNPIFTLIVGNPPFGDKIRKGDRDQLGGNHLDAFELAGDSQLSSEIAVIERAIKWLRPGNGRLGMVVPDGVLNNPGENSRCPAFRRFLFCNVQILAIVSLPDHAFRRSGAQNKTSVLFVRRWSEDRRRELEHVIATHRNGGGRDGDDPADFERALGLALAEHDYPVFLAEAEHIGYTATGVSTELNDLYSGTGFDVDDASDTILGQYRLFLSDPEDYRTCVTPACTALMASDLYAQHPSHRIDSKYFTFKGTEEIQKHRAGKAHRLGSLLARRREKIVPSDHPEREFKTVTLTLQGEMKPREPGKGRNLPGWHGSYFPIGQKWFVAREGDIVASRIDLWKGCIGVTPSDFDGAIVTGEFPVYRIRSEHSGIVDGRYLQMLLRSSYFRRALRAVTTGHSNRRRTQEADFFDLVVPLPDLSVQVRIADGIEAVKRRRDRATADLQRLLGTFDRAIEGDLGLDALAGLG